MTQYLIERSVQKDKKLDTVFVVTSLLEVLKDGKGRNISVNNHCAIAAEYKLSTMPYLIFPKKFKRELTFSEFEALKILAVNDIEQFKNIDVEGDFNHYVR